LAALTQLLSITVRLDVKKIISEGDDAAIFFELETRAPAEATVLVAEWHQFKNGRISHVESAFDGRPYAAMFTAAARTEIQIEGRRLDARRQPGSLSRRGRGGQRRSNHGRTRHLVSAELVSGWPPDPFLSKDPGPRSNSSRQRGRHRLDGAHHRSREESG